jgi:hypothetical protein
MGLAAAPIAGALASPLPPQIHTVAGGGSCAGAPATLASGQACDGVKATSTPIDNAGWVSAIPGGGYLFVDEGNDLVREVSATGVVTTVAGTSYTNAEGQSFPSTTDTDGELAIDSGLDDPVSAAALPDGGFLITEAGGCRVREVSPGGPGVATITTIAGTGTCTPSAADFQSSGVATSVTLDDPLDAEPTADGGVLIADTGDNAVRYVGPDGTITTIAGGPSFGCNDVTTVCDGHTAGSVGLDAPDSVSPISGGNGAFLVDELYGDAVREISAESPSGIFSTVAGTTQSFGYTGDGGPATFAQLNQPRQVVSLAAGGFLIADSGNDVIREVSPNGTISTIAGDGPFSFGGDGGAATAASLASPASVAPLANGNTLIADYDNNRVREITLPSVSTISLVPATPTGLDGWYTTSPLVVVTATGKASVQCEADPPAAPTLYGEIPTGCAFSGAGAAVAGNGSHTIYAASQNSFGDQENPVSLSFNVDSSVPTITCTGYPLFTYGGRSAVVTGTLSDAVSGPQDEPLSQAAVTSKLGAGSAALSGSSTAGQPLTILCPYYVTPATLSPSPKAKYAFEVTATYTAVERLRVLDIPIGASVAITCSGGGCPFALRRHVKTRPCRSCKRRRPELRMVDATKLFAGAKLLPGAKLAVRITKRGAVGRYLQFIVRNGGQAAYTKHCLAPGATKPGRRCSPKLPAGAA